jgi:hypothetical protein
LTARGATFFETIAEIEGSDQRNLISNDIFSRQILLCSTSAVIRFSNAFSGFLVVILAYFVRLLPVFS